MGNMSYYRFRNTLSDLRDCLDAIRDGDASNEVLSEDELRAKKSLVQVCKEILEEEGFEITT